MQFLKSEAYDQQFVKENLMGPNALKIVEELTEKLDLHPGMRVLDLGCGKGLTSIFLAKEYGVTVYAAELWTDPTENFHRFAEMGLADRIFPICADAERLPFAKEYFDMIISVDAYHYFGRDAGFLDEKIAPFLNKEGSLALAFPGVKAEIKKDVPASFYLSWQAEDLVTFHSIDWWKKRLSQSNTMRLQCIEEMACFASSWKDWLETENPYAVNDRKAMEAGAGAYMNLISVYAQKKTGI